MLGMLIVFLPLFSAVFVGLNTRKLGAGLAQFISCGAVIVAAISAWIAFFKINSGAMGAQDIFLMQWLAIGEFKAEWAIRLDILSASMMILVTTVSALVHIYSIGYMSDDAHRQRFMSYLSLFTFFMLVLVSSNNFLQLFVGWEGVGLCSYLLIGFWFKKESANLASMKAFLVNRVGDFGLALGIFMIFTVFDSIMFDEVFNRAELLQTYNFEFLGFNANAITMICILLFIGCMGKSAQLGLHTWLPDAMEGPTPVSALIHAATMVTAGVFLVTRCSPLFELSEVALMMVTIVGAVTCIFAATIAITQHDIKRVIAYSTCSQLGYMFFACGVSAYSAGMFHLLTHGFFKALLFLGAGSVIHAMHHEQDMRNMGGLWKKIPFTYIMMLLGTLAIVGVPPFAGFFSKDIVLESAYAAGHDGTSQFGMLAFWLGVLAAFLTSFYSWRLIFLTFHGKSRASKETQSHIHESPFSMTLPLFILALGAVFAGWIGASYLGIVDHDLKFWQGAVTSLDSHNPLDAAHHSPKWVKFSALMVGSVGFVLAILCYLFRTNIASAAAKIFKPIYKLLFNKYYIDELYDFLFVRSARGIGNFFWKFIDTSIIDKFGPNGFAWCANIHSKLVSKSQTGYVYHYVFAMILGLVGLVSYVAYKMLG